MPYPMPSSAPSPISPLQCTCSSPPDEPPLPPLRAQARRPSTRHRMLHQKHLKSAGGSMRVRSKAELMEALNEVPRGGGEGGGAGEEGIWIRATAGYLIGHLASCSEGHSKKWEGRTNLKGSVTAEFTVILASYAESLSPLCPPVSLPCYSCPPSPPPPPPLLLPPHLAPPSQPRPLWPYCTWRWPRCTPRWRCSRSSDPR